MNCYQDYSAGGGPIAFLAEMLIWLVIIAAMYYAGARYAENTGSICKENCW